MHTDSFPERLTNLHFFEEVKRSESLGLIGGDVGLQLHIIIIERAMDLADIFRQYPTDDEDLKVIQLLGMRIFNAFGASLKLALSGYGQNSALVIRDILETVFLLDLFKGKKELIEQWRFADKREQMKKFSPVKVRIALDTRDGFTGKKRAKIYELFSELASHPTMKSDWMMRPQREGNAVIGPFVEKTMLEAVISEMGRLAIQFGEILNQFFPEKFEQGVPAQMAFTEAKKIWIEEFYPDTTIKRQNESVSG